MAHSPLDFDKVLPGHAVFLSHVKDFSRSQHANVSDPEMVANNYCSLSQSHSVMLTNKFTIIKFTFKKEKKQLQFILCLQYDDWMILEVWRKLPEKMLFNKRKRKLQISINLTSG